MASSDAVRSEVNEKSPRASPEQATDFNAGIVRVLDERERLVFLKRRAVCVTHS